MLQPSLSSEALCGYGEIAPIIQQMAAAKPDQFLNWYDMCSGKPFSPNSASEIFRITRPLGVSYTGVDIHENTRDYDMLARTAGEDAVEYDFRSQPDIITCVRGLCCLAKTHGKNIVPEEGARHALRALDNWTNALKIGGILLADIPEGLLTPIEKSRPDIAKSVTHVNSRGYPIISYVKS